MDEFQHNRTSKCMHIHTHVRVNITHHKKACVQKSISRIAIGIHTYTHTYIHTYKSYQAFSPSNLLSWTFTGNMGDLTGQAVATGDVNGDGYGDIVMGSQYGDGDGRRRHMRVCMYVCMYAYVCMCTQLHADGLCSLLSNPTWGQQASG
jgi:hypothetical protein